MMELWNWYLIFEYFVKVNENNTFINSVKKDDDLRELKFMVYKSY